MLRDQRGFNLTNILVAVAIVAAIVGGVNYWRSSTARENARHIAKEQAEAIRSRYTNLLKLDAAWKNTQAAIENASMACLRLHKPCPHSNAPMILRDGMNRSVYDAINPKNGITLDGTNCGNFVETGNDNCPFRLDLNWDPQCDTFDDCLDPPSVVFKGRLRFRASQKGNFAGLKIPDVTFEVSRLVMPGTRRNCYDQLKGGGINDGLYVVQPNPDAPPFSVYCDQTHDGGGWAIVASAGNSGYSSIPEIETLIPGTNGHLPAAKIKAYLESSSFQNQNNVRLNLPDVDGGLTLSASTSGAVDADAYQARMTKGKCKTVIEAPNFATHQGASLFSILFYGGGEAGLQDVTTSKEGYYGFFACFGTSPVGKVCGMGCERQWKGQALRQKGSLWIR